MSDFRVGPIGKIIPGYENTRLAVVCALASKLKLNLKTEQNPGSYKDYRPVGVVQTYDPGLSIKNGPWLAGGAILRAITGEEDADYDFDFFFVNQQQMWSFRDALRKEGDQDIEYSHPSAHEYDTFDFNWNDNIIQYIGGRFCSEVVDHLKAFSYICTMLATDGDQLLYHRRTLNDIEFKLLRKNRFGDLPKISATRKYQRREFIEI